MDDMDCDLVPVAIIYSRPELECFVSALGAEGIHVCVVGNHHGRTEQLLLALGGYSVRVPAFQLDEAVSLTAELRVGTDAVIPSRALRKRLWSLVAIMATSGALNGVIAMQAPEQSGHWAFGLLGLASVAAFAFPITTPGDYRNRRGYMVQLV